MFAPWTLPLAFVLSACATQTVLNHNGPDTLKLITPELSDWIDSQLEGHRAGLTLGIVRIGGEYDQSEFEFGAWGNKTEHGDKADPHTLFNIGSCSKAFLGASIGLLIDDFAAGRNVTALPDGVARLTWDTKMKGLFPDDWQLADPLATSEATIKDLLTHVTGLPRHDNMYAPSESPLDIVRKLRHLRPTRELRQQYHYNNAMYITGSHIVETLSGMSYEDYVASRIFGPLNMDVTTFFPSRADPTHLSHCWTEGGRRVPFPFDDQGAKLIAGAGGVISSVTDMTKWLEMLLREGLGPSANVTVIPQDIFEDLTTAYVVINGRGSVTRSIQGYGLGWTRFSYRGHDVLQHAGNLRAFNAYVVVVPSLGLGAVNFVNAEDLDWLNDAVVLRVIDKLLGPETETSARLLTSSASNPVWSRPATDGDGNSAHPLSKFAGTYENLGYGRIALCAPASESTYCSEVRHTFDAVDSANTSSKRSEYQLVAALKRARTTHAHMAPSPILRPEWIHHRNMTFALFMTELFTEGYGADTRPFEFPVTERIPILVEFAAASDRILGFGYFDYNDGLVLRKGTAKQRAYTWFDRIDGDS
ncbi:beta-lactamase/transpeptidase-like protein [Punctularia strigosozonata HHB-11173 SS5]|uniref:beta-lactamase/transpeptidase-like protein n=1 Tax=Punctularia strigosozonata (strain HHB-11173) TaxID=741275 RepID=UPI00044181C4|nr:beta-lactamase/transpeptidase-like protein [Punctularia strigosozonata HHB-11173 SS5]EIN12842.1 beta-lactamase/transpeptidase-like protein [Punctularia strigosozonata HHB-11173 SS5]